MTRVVLDTNVLVSALVFGGTPRKVLRLAVSGAMKLIISEILLEELKGVLEGPKFRYLPNVTQLILNELLLIAEIVVPSLKIDHITSDPDDNRILECAVEGDADMIVSGDSDLLDLKEFRGIPILTPAEFLSF